VWRRYDADGILAGDVLTLASDAPPPGAVPLLEPVMRAGVAVGPAPSLADARARARAELARLPEPLRALEGAPLYEAEVSPALRALAAEIDART
jgi:nicotinate phosphoribosyltransferase